MMDAFDSLLSSAPQAKPAGKSAPVDAFDALLAPRKKAVRVESSLDLGPDPGLSLDSEPSFSSHGMPFLNKAGRAAYDKEQAAADALRKERRSYALNENYKGTAATLVGHAADIGDFIPDTGLQIAGVAADWYKRIASGFEGATPSEQGAQGAKLRHAINENGGFFKKKFRELGILPEYHETVMEAIGQVLGGFVERGGAAASEGSDGAITPNDVSLMADEAMAFLGGKGIYHGGKKAFAAGRDYLGARKEAARKSAADAEMAANRMHDEEAAAEQLPSTGDLAASELQGIQTRRQVAGMLKTPERQTQEPLTTPSLRQLRAQARAIQETRGAGATGEVPPELSAAIAKEELRVMEAKRKARASFVQDPVPDAAELPDMVEPQLGASPGLPYGKAAVAATGLGLAMALEPDDRERALAIGAGAFMLGKGHELTLDTIGKMPDTAPLGAFLDRSPVTLSTLEMLPKNRFEFGVDSIEQLLKRESVTKAERGVFREVLDARPAGAKTITAKDLMAGVKKATGDFELKRTPTDQFADYGLDRIGRYGRTHIDPDAWADATPAERAAVEAQEIPAQTTIYQSPVSLGSNNHFGDPNYFAHTRSFEEGGVRHVVELQSDLAQKAGKAIAPEERLTLQTELAKDKADLALLREELGGRPLNGMPQSFRENVQAVSVRIAEAESKLRDAATSELVGPMLKSWHKRLIREELADAARGESVIPNHPDQWGRELRPPAKVVRFADADTVAKVEGWPDSGEARRSQLAGAQERLASAKEHVANLEAMKRGEAPKDDYYSALKTADPEAYDRVIKHIDAEISYAQETLRESQLQFERTSSNWGDQIRFSLEHQGIYDRYSGDVTKFLKQLGGKHVVDSAGHGWWEVPVEGSKALPAGKRAQQFGGASQDLLNAGAAIGLSAAAVAYLSPQDKRLRNAGIGAVLAGLALLARSRSPQIAEWAKQAGRGAEYTLGMVSTQIGEISRPLLHRMREHERRVLTSTHDSLKVVAPFIEGLRKTPKELRDKLNLAILSNDSTAVIKLLGQSGNAALIGEWKKARALLDSLGKDLQATGRLKGLLPDYYPRVVIDPAGLMKALGKEERSYLQTLLDNAQAKAARFDGRDLSPLEVSQIINGYLKSRSTGGTGKPGFLKKRSVGEIDETLAPYYAPASESLPLYIRAVSKEIERARFFGDDLVRAPEGGLANIDLSIGNVVNRERLARKLTDEQVEKLRSVLQSRFGPGERTSSGLLQTAKNLTNAGLLGHVTSAFVQTGDVILSVAAHDFLPSIKALQQIVTRQPARIRPSDLGLVDHISEEISGGSKRPMTVFGRQLSSARFLEKVFKYSGFSIVDQLGKNVSSNAAFNKYTSWAQTPVGVARIKAKYGEAYGKDFPALVEDLRARKLTDNTRGLLFSELSDIQPISKLEVPQAYLDMPNGRVVYMLKTFMLKQADLIRREVAQEFAKGNVAKATSAAIRYGLALGIAGASTDFVRNWLLGRDQKLEWGDIPENALKTFGWSSYVVDKARKGKPIEAAVGVAAPPYKMWQDIITADPSAIQYLPLAGRLLYAHEFGGKEKANASAERRERAKEREDAK